MALIDHSFHDVDIERWVSNFNELPEPEYIIQNLDELGLSDKSQELRAILNKDGTLARIVDALVGADMLEIYSWILKPAYFIDDTGIEVNDPNYVKFLSEFIPGYALYRNQWDRNQLGNEVRDFYNNLVQPYNRENTRLKKCTSCGYNLTDLFATALTADNILDDTPVNVVCPHCNVLNYIKY